MISYENTSLSVMMPAWARYLCERHPAPFARLAEAVFDVFDGSERRSKPIVVCGDFNTSHREIDLKNPKANENTSGFLPVEQVVLYLYLFSEWKQANLLYTDAKDF